MVLIKSFIHNTCCSGRLIQCTTRCYVPLLITGNLTDHCIYPSYGRGVIIDRKTDSFGLVGIYLSSLYCFKPTRPKPNTLRNNDVVITSKRRHFDVITSKWRRFDVITTLFLRHVFVGRLPWASICAVSSESLVLSYLIWEKDMGKKLRLHSLVLVKLIPILCKVTLTCMYERKPCEDCQFHLIMSLQTTPKILGMSAIYSPWYELSKPVTSTWIKSLVCSFVDYTRGE